MANAWAATRSVSARRQSRKQGGGEERRTTTISRRPIRPLRPPHPERGWDILQLLEAKPYTSQWKVPWGPALTIGGFLMWGSTFVLTELAAGPVANLVAGSHPRDMPAEQRAELLAFLQAAQLAEGVGFAWLLNRAKGPLPKGWLNYNPVERPLDPAEGWLLWSFLGILLAPSAVYVAAVLAEKAGLGAGSAGTADPLLPLLKEDTKSILPLLVVSSLSAPILEELVFRGFLLPSLTAEVGTPAAVASSSAAFALCHAAPRDMLQLFVLGCVLGFAYVRTRNLLTPTVIHAAWNGGAILALLALSDQMK